MAENSDLLRNANNSFKAFAYQKLTINGTVARLTVPDGARYATMKFVSDATGNSANILQFNMPVTATDGFPIADGTVFDVTDTVNLVGFNIIQSQSGTHTLYVEYAK